MKTITFKELKQKKEKIMNELFGQALSKHYTYLGNLSDNKFKNIEGELTMSISDILHILEKHLGNIEEQQLLTDQEKAYLKAVIDPFKEQVKYIIKRKESVWIATENYESISLNLRDLPYKFENLELYEQYFDLKDLGLNNETVKNDN